jgi:hypothetical protein
MMSKAAVCVAIGAPVALVLQGCGGGGSTTAGPAPAPVSNTTTTTPTAERTPGWSVEMAVQELNAAYMAFNESDDSTALGVTLSYAGKTDSFDENIHCEGYADTYCYQGQSDCRMSGAVLNHKVMVRDHQGQYGNETVVVPLMNRPIGYVFNQSLVENYFGKCTYLFDGAASFNLNQGCGASAPPPNSCDSERAAFHDMCTSDGGDTFHRCTATDPEVTSRKCKCESCDTPYGEINPPRFKTDETCYYEMPALIVPYEDPESFSPSSTNHLRDALKQRVLSDDQTNQHQEWNEVIIDNRLLIPQINYDPTHTIVAFFYVAGGSVSDEAALSMATIMRDQFQHSYGVSGVGDIPVVELDARNDFRTSGGPFKLPPPPSHIAI